MNAFSRRPGYAKRYVARIVMDEHPLPTEFLATCTDVERQEVLQWWHQLERLSHAELAVLLDQRSESCAYIFDPDKSDWFVLPIEGDHLASNDDPREFERERFNEWLCHVINHPELMDNWDVTDFAIRSFHICTNHPLAIQTRTDGRIPGDFACPAQDKDCPIATFAESISDATLLSSAPDGTFSIWLCRRGETAT